MDQDKIWEFFQNDESIGNMAFQADLRYVFLASQIKHGERVLNIGVGRGGLEALLIEKNVEIYCLDPSEKSILALRERFGLSERAKVGYSQCIPFENDSFDVVVMSEVLEHLSDDVLHATVTECHRIIKTGGKFIGTVPAEEDLQESIVVCAHCGTAAHRWGHQQSFKKERLEGIFNLEFSKVVVQRRYFGAWNHLNWKGKILHLIKKTLCLFGVRGSGENYYFSATK